MNVILMMKEIWGVANSMIGKSALPDFRFSSDESAEGVRVSSLD